MRVGAYVYACGRTDRGRDRLDNEDAFLLAEASDRPLPPFQEGVVAFDGEGGVLLAVSDGIGGGEAAGEAASATALDAFHAALADLLPNATPDVALRGGFECANRAVASAARTSRRPELGATLTAALLSGRCVHVSTVGDSRAYLFRCGRLMPLTHDQSYAQLLIDSGALREDEARNFSLRAVILQAIGWTPTLSIAINRLELRRGDRLLLCSDGLSGELKDHEIAALMTQGGGLDETCRALVEAAIAHGGSDNMTVVLASLEGDTLPLPAADDPMVGTLTKVPDLLDAAFGPEVAFVQ